LRLPLWLQRHHLTSVVTLSITPQAQQSVATGGKLWRV
jgi:hypothetical protein